MEGCVLDAHAKVDFCEHGNELNGR